MIYGIKRASEFVGITPARFKEYMNLGKFTATKVKRGGVYTYAFKIETLLKELENWNY